MISIQNEGQEVVLANGTAYGPSLESGRFSIDDAFSEGGEDRFEFSTESLRRELARSSQAAHSFAGDGEHGFEDIQIEPSYNDADTSISTLDINAPAIDEPDAALQSESHIHDSVSPEHTPQVNERVEKSNEEAAAQSEDEINGTNSSSHHPFPSVVIDVSGEHASHVRVVSQSTPEVAHSQLSASSNSVEAVSGNEVHIRGGSVDGTSIPTSQSLPNPATTTRPAAHRPSKSTGPSALEKVVSKTRPTFLPPKPKHEDLQHQAVWETMMKQSREAAERKRKLKQERRLARERAVEQYTTVWEQRIIPDWKTASREPGMRKLMWKGVPPKLRSIVWEKAVGNGLALSKDSYRACLARAKRALSSGTFPTTTLNLVDADIRTTFPTLHIFTPNTGPMYEDLLDMLCAWVVSRSDEGMGYVMGASKIAAMFLLNMQPPMAFMAMRNLLERHCMRSFYGGLASKDDVEAYYRIFDTLLADCMPKVYFNFKQHQISPAAYFPDWIIPLFLDHLPLECCARIWDVLLLEGDSFLFRAALGVLASLEARLFFPDRKELLSLLSGENKAAIEVARRDGALLGSCKYEIFGLDEETVWEKIDGLEGWWKQSTWERLLTRELPDL